VKKPKINLVVKYLHLSERALLDLVGKMYSEIQSPYFSQKVRSPTPEALQNEGLNRALASKYKGQCVDVPRLKIIIN
jgi:hypothetical protein